jgi:predicted transposase YbfD/YdcC
MSNQETLEQFSACWEGLEDPRSGNAGLHDFHELLVIALCAVLCCAVAIAEQIVERKGDYALALKGNQGTLHDDVRLLLDDPETKTSTSAPAVDGDHGRVETRTATVSADIGWLQKQHRWPGLAAIGKVERIRETAEKKTSETAYYLLSTALTPERLNQVVRQHWSVENCLHWRLDVVMNEDQDRTRLGNGPHNLAVLRHMALNAMQKEGSKGSLRGKFKRAGWDHIYLIRLLEMF